MANRWTVVMGAGVGVAVLSIMVFVAAPPAGATPASGGTDTTSESGATDIAKHRGAEGKVDVAREDATDEGTGDTGDAAEPIGTDRPGNGAQRKEHTDRVFDEDAAATDEIDATGVAQSETLIPAVTHGSVETDSLVETDTLVETEGPAEADSLVATVSEVTDPADTEEVGTTVADASFVSRNPNPAEKRTGADTASVPVAATDTPTRAPTLLNVVGSLVLNLLVGLIQVIDGPPVLPPNSTVTVRTSTLTLPIGTGRAVQADWYFPEDVNESTRLIYLQHGFLASAPMYSYTAARLAERTDAIVVAPSLTSNFFAPDAVWVGGVTMQRAVAELFVGDRTALAESASAAAGHTIVLPQMFVLVGHSAGGTLVTSAAGFMADSGAIADLAGIVMLDGVEPVGSGLVSDALVKLRDDNDRPIYLLSSDRYFWNRGGDMADKLHLARPDRFTGVGLTGGLHIDYMEGGNPLIQFAQYLVGGFSLQRNIDAATDISVGWVNDLFAGTTSSGVYGDPKDVITVATPTGAATAVVLPLGQPARPVWPPLLDAILTAVFDFGGRYLFVYEPLRGYEPESAGAVAHLLTS